MSDNEPTPQAPADGIEVHMDLGNGGLTFGAAPSPLERLLEYCDDSDGSQYGTLSTSLVRDLIKAELADRASQAPATDCDECDALRMNLADLLTRTANALRGQPEPGRRWSWHDLPDRAAAAIAAIDVMQRTAASLAAESESFRQAVLDPENQPSQYGTVLLAPAADERAEFEAWAMQRGLARCDLSFEGSYHDSEVHGMWLGWQARATRSGAVHAAPNADHVHPAVQPVEPAAFSTADQRSLLAVDAEPAAWLIDTHGFKSVALRKADLGLLAERYAVPLYAEPPKTEWPFKEGALLDPLKKLPNPEASQPEAWTWLISLKDEDIVEMAGTLQAAAAMVQQMHEEREGLLRRLAALQADKVRGTESEDAAPWGESAHEQLRVAEESLARYDHEPGSVGRDRCVLDARKAIACLSKLCSPPAPGASPLPADQGEGDK